MRGDLFWPTEAQMERLRPCFAESHARPCVDDRRVATRYDRCPKIFLSVIALAAKVIYWL